MKNIKKAIKDMSNAQKAHDLDVFIWEQVEQVRQGSVIGSISNDRVISECVKDDEFVMAVIRSWGCKDSEKQAELLNKKAYEMLLEQHIGANS